MSQFAWTFPAGNIHQEVTSITLVNNTAKTEEVLVPTGKIWLLMFIKMTNSDDVQRTLSCNLWLETAKTNLLARMFYVATGAAGSTYWPGGETDIEGEVGTLILVGGNKLECTWAAGGASTGAVDADGLVMCYLEIDVP